MTTLSEYHYKTSIVIRFADIDSFGHVNNAVYFTYLEIARSNYWNEIIAWDWNAMGIIIARAEIDYLKPVVLTDKLSCYVRTSRIGKTSFDLDYALVRTAGDVEELCATAKTVCVAFDYQIQQPAAIPDIHRIKMQEFELLTS